MARGTRRVEVRVVVHVDQDRMAGGSVATAICSELIGVRRTEMRGRVGGAAAMVARIGGHSAIGGRTLRGPMARLVGRVARRLFSLVGGLLQVVGLREVALGVVLSLAAVVLSVIRGLAEVIWTVRLSVPSASRIACSGGRVRCFGIGSWSDNVARGCQWWIHRYRASSGGLCISCGAHVAHYLTLHLMRLRCLSRTNKRGSPSAARLVVKRLTLTRGRHLMQLGLNSRCSPVPAGLPRGLARRDPLGLLSP